MILDPDNLGVLIHSSRSSRLQVKRWGSRDQKSVANYACPCEPQPSIDRGHTQKQPHLRERPYTDGEAPAEMREKRGLGNTVKVAQKRYCAPTTWTREQRCFLPLNRVMDAVWLLTRHLGLRSPVTAMDGKPFVPQIEKYKFDPSTHKILIKTDHIPCGKGKFSISPYFHII